MSVPFNRTVITATWFVVLGLVALLWSPPSFAMGMLVLFVGLACPALMVLLWPEPELAVVRAVARTGRQALPGELLSTTCSTPGA